MIASVQTRPVQNLFGVPIDALTMDEVLSAVEETIRHHERLLIGVVNAAKIVRMQDRVTLRDAVLSADMILPDGMSVVWASRLLRRQLPQRVPGIDLMHRILEQGSANGYRVFCLGASEDILTTAVERMRADYPGVVIAGSHHGYFDEAQEPRIVEQIRAAKPDVLFAAMNSPKKEVFLARWAGQMDVPVCHGVGGSFDVLAGKVKRAPETWQKLGMEWLYRVVQEPRRMWRRYAVTNSLFCWMVLRRLFSSSGRARG